MKKSIDLILLSTFCLFLFSTQAGAYVTETGFLCVDGSGAASLGDDFQAALDAVTADNYDVRLIEGTFAIPGDPAVHFNIETDHSLTISGGWNADCSAQTADPGLTILQGGTLQPESTYFFGGGVLFVYIFENLTPATLVISNVTIENGLAESDGGGLSIQHDYNTNADLANVNISHVVVRNNITEVWFGSGIAVEDWGTTGGMSVTIADSLVQGNTVPSGSTAGPAGIFIDNYGFAAQDTTISRCQILENAAGADGGGLFINSGFGNATLVNNLIAVNSVTTNYGGGIFIDNSDGGAATLTNNTITGNSGESSAGGIYANLVDPTSVLNIYNNIIYGNTATGAGAVGADLYINNQAAQVVNLFNNDFDNTPAGFLILDDTNYTEALNLNNSDPLFVSAPTDYHLQSGSPVIDAGDNAAPSVPVDDLEGNFRCGVDMGAYEYQGALPGDVNYDGAVDIQDAIDALQVLTGLTPIVPVCGQSDANNDGRIGVEDVLFILQNIARLRP